MNKLLTSLLLLGSVSAFAAEHSEFKQFNNEYSNLSKRPQQIQIKRF